MFSKEQFDWLLENSIDICPICIPSYNRWDRKKNKTLTRVIETADSEIQANTFVFVRREQMEAYRENYPTVNIVPLPNVNGLAGTRQYICDFVTRDLKAPHFMDMDDDILNLKAVILRNGQKACVSRKGEVSQSQIIRFGYEIAKLAFSRHGCVLGSMKREHFANRYNNTQTAYVTNMGATPRQVMYIDAKRLEEIGVRRNLAFDPTGDDVGFVAEIAKKSGSFFNISCLAYSFVDDAVNSTIRNDSNRKALASYEYECLKKYPMGQEYLRIPFTFEDGSYRFGDIDFAKYRKVTGVNSDSVSLNTLYVAKRGVK